MIIKPASMVLDEEDIEERYSCFVANYVWRKLQQNNMVSLPVIAPVSMVNLMILWEWIRVLPSTFDRRS